MKTVTHTVYPVSYISDDGTQRDTLWGHRPVGDEYFVGEPMQVSAEHPETMGEDKRAAEIAALEKRIAQLRGVAA